jgi:hypothetical protein
MVVTS